MGTIIQFLEKRIQEDISRAAGTKHEQRVRAESHLKTRLLRLHTGAHNDHNGKAEGPRILRYHSCYREGHPGYSFDSRSASICDTLKMLAAPYAEHPAFDAEWEAGSA